MRTNLYSHQSPSSREVGGGLVNIICVYIRIVIAWDRLYVHVPSNNEAKRIFGR
jgi:hypothetical protein